MTAVSLRQEIHDAIVEAWAHKTHFTNLRGPVEIGDVLEGGVTDTLIWIAAGVAAQREANS